MMTEIVTSDPLRAHKRITVKIGSALLVDPTHGLRQDWMESIVADLADLRADGCEILIVSSGAIATGRTLLGLPERSLRLEESQAAASVGQIRLAHEWNAAFARHGIITGQVLLTLDDTEARRRYLNARATMGTLLKMGAIPVINENDTVATTEIRYGDNDRLAARVATMIEADLLVLLSDIDGLYTAPPASNPDARHLPAIETITPEIEAMAGGAASHLSRGGMRTKIDAAKIATQAGTAMIIANGTVAHPLAALANGARHTRFEAAAHPVSAWKSWIGGQLETQGALHVDAGAYKALMAGSSLLAAGIRSVTGSFSRGDTVSICLEGASGEVARGLVAYGDAECRQIAGHRSEEIEAILGHAPRSAVVHRDDLTLTRSAS